MTSAKISARILPPDAASRGAALGNVNPHSILQQPNPKNAPSVSVANNVFDSSAVHESVSHEGSTAGDVVSATAMGNKTAQEVGSAGMVGEKGGSCHVESAKGKQQHVVDKETNCHLAFRDLCDVVGQRTGNTSSKAANSVSRPTLSALTNTNQAGNNSEKEIQSVSSNDKQEANGDVVPENRKKAIKRKTTRQLDYTPKCKVADDTPCTLRRSLRPKKSRVTIESDSDDDDDDDSDEEWNGDYNVDDEKEKREERLAACTKRIKSKGVCKTSKTKQATSKKSEAPTKSILSGPQNGESRTDSGPVSANQVEKPIPCGKSAAADNMSLSERISRLISSNEKMLAGKNVQVTGKTKCYKTMPRTTCSVEFSSIESENPVQTSASGNPSPPAPAIPPLPPSYTTLLAFKTLLSFREALTVVANADSGKTMASAAGGVRPGGAAGYSNDPPLSQPSRVLADYRNTTEFKLLQSRFNGLFLWPALMSRIHPTGKIPRFVNWKPVRIAQEVCSGRNSVGFGTLGVKDNQISSNPQNVRCSGRAVDGSTSGTASYAGTVGRQDISGSQEKAAKTTSAGSVVKGMTSASTAVVTSQTPTLSSSAAEASTVIATDAVTRSDKTAATVENTAGNHCKSTVRTTTNGIKRKDNEDTREHSNRASKGVETQRSAGSTITKKTQVDRNAVRRERAHTKRLTKYTERMQSGFLSSKSPAQDYITQSTVSIVVPGHGGRVAQSRNKDTAATERAVARMPQKGEAVLCQDAAKKSRSKGSNDEKNATVPLRRSTRIKVAAVNQGLVARMQENVSSKETSENATDVSGTLGHCVTAAKTTATDQETSPKMQDDLPSLHGVIPIASEAVSSPGSGHLPRKRPSSSDTASSTTDCSLEGPNSKRRATERKQYNETE